MNLGGESPIRRVENIPIRNFHIPNHVFLSVFPCLEPSISTDQSLSSTPQLESNMYKVGTAKVEVTAFKKDVGMMGYGMTWNTVHDVETPLYSRAFFFQHQPSGRNAVVVVTEMAFVTQSVRQGVLKRLRRKHADLQLSESDILLSAQHTHSGPGGYSHYGLYNITVPGFVPEVYTTLVDGITRAIVLASQNLQEARLTLAQGTFPDDVPVAFNRSMRAYLKNPEAGALSPDQSHLAVDRTMPLLRIDSPDGKPIAALNWFGVHTTSVHNDNHSICWDNKGYAADFMERDLRQSSGNPDFLAAFAQGTAGDVTPNYVWDAEKKWTRGPFKDDFESARHNGRLQYQLARDIHREAVQGKPIEGPPDSALVNVNFANVACDPDFTGGRSDCRTGPACHGVAFFQGTKEGPGMEPAVANVAKGLSRFIKFYENAVSIFWKKERRAAMRQKYRVHGRKIILFEAGNRKVLGSGDIANLIVPAFVDESIRNLKRLHPKGWKEDKPWVPHVLPLQLLTLGNLAFAAIPAEITTIAGQRLRQTLESELAAAGIEQVILFPYSNAYCGYITTHEEYQVQCYEGGHTVYGEWTLAAFQTRFRELARELTKKAQHRRIEHDARLPEFSQEELAKRMFQDKNDSSPHEDKNPTGLPVL